MEPFYNTHIVLIPKIVHLNSLVHFLPISLCNVIYKVISKTIANQYQKVLDVCIDEAQSTFVPKRMITDSILLAYEVLHSFK